MKARKFQAGQEWVSGSELAANIIEAISNRQFVLTKDLAEKNENGFYFDGGYIVAMNDILAMVMTDPKSVDPDKKALSEEETFNLEELE